MTNMQTRRHVLKVMTAATVASTGRYSGRANVQCVRYILAILR